MLAAAHVWLIELYARLLLMWHLPSDYSPQRFFGVIEDVSLVVAAVVLSCGATLSPSLRAYLRMLLGYELLKCVIMPISLIAAASQLGSAEVPAITIMPFEWVLWALVIMICAVTPTFRRYAVTYTSILAIMTLQLTIDYWAHLPLP
jgi:hypothetical protein